MYAGSQHLSMGTKRLVKAVSGRSGGGGVAGAWPTAQSKETDWHALILCRFRYLCVRADRACTPACGMPVERRRDRACAGRHTMTVVDLCSAGSCILDAVFPHTLGTLDGTVERLLL